eukprot:359550-Chlamydomonas_euryale.AAC.8
MTCTPAAFGPRPPPGIGSSGPSACADRRQGGAEHVHQPFTLGPAHRCVYHARDVCQPLRGFVPHQMDGGGRVQCRHCMLDVRLGAG